MFYSEKPLMEYKLIFCRENRKLKYSLHFLNVSVKIIRLDQFAHCVENDHQKMTGAFSFIKSVLLCYCVSVQNWDLYRLSNSNCTIFCFQKDGIEDKVHYIFEDKTGLVRSLLLPSFQRLNIFLRTGRFGQLAFISLSLLCKGRADGVARSRVLTDVCNVISCFPFVNKVNKKFASMTITKKNRAVNVLDEPQVGLSFFQKTTAGYLKSPM